MQAHPSILILHTKNCEGLGVKSRDIDWVALEFELPSFIIKNWQCIMIDCLKRLTWKLEICQFDFWQTVYSLSRVHLCRYHARDLIFLALLCITENVGVSRGRG